MSKGLYANFPEKIQTGKNDRADKKVDSVANDI